MGWRRAFTHPNKPPAAISASRIQIKHPEPSRISITPETSTPLFPYATLHPHSPAYKNRSTIPGSINTVNITAIYSLNLYTSSLPKSLPPISMAASLALKRAVATSSLFSKLLNPSRLVELAPTASRLFNTNAQMTCYDDSDDSSLEVNQRDRSVSNRRRPDVPSVFSDVFDPLSPTRSLTQVLNMMDQFMENPFLATSRGMGTGAR
ncbi:unnamed protein product [Rhodiola kirilowii]